MLLISIVTVLVLGRNSLAETGHDDNHEDPGESLFLTPLLEQGKIVEARNVSKVEPLLNDHVSHSGFFTVDKRYNSNMFFWYFPAERNAETAPLILWLQGGPGSSSLVGFFEEIGPFNVSSEYKLISRSAYWSMNFNVLFVDNPVGTGFSFTDNEEGHCTSETCIANNLLEFLKQFYTLFPETKKNDLYLSGQSYACKYQAHLGHLIHTHNSADENKINLKGLTIGNGFCDPIRMMDHGTVLYSSGIIDDQGKEDFDRAKDELIKYIENEQWSRAHDLCDNFIGSHMFISYDTPDSNVSLFQRVTGLPNLYNLVSEYPIPSYWEKYIMSSTFRNQLHIGNVNFSTGEKTFDLLKNVHFKSVANLIEELLDNYKIMIYSGQFDVMVPYTTTLDFIKHLKWCGSDEYSKANRTVWSAHGNIALVAGYTKVSAPDHCKGSLIEVLVRNAGHSVPADRPFEAFEMLFSFVMDLPPFTGPESKYKSILDYMRQNIMHNN